jgi:hypothetical protein
LNKYLLPILPSTLHPADSALPRNQKKRTSVTSIANEEMNSLDVRAHVSVPGVTLDDIQHEHRLITVGRIVLIDAKTGEEVKGKGASKWNFKYDINDPETARS